MTEKKGNLVNVLKPRDPVNVKPVLDQIEDSILSSGLPVPDRLIIDGNIHRWSTNGKSRDKSGWYVFYDDERVAGKFGCWRQDIESVFVEDTGRQMSAKEQLAHSRRLQEAKRARDVERQKTFDAAKESMQQIWTQAASASAEHPYLKRKKIQPNGARVTGDGRLVVPLYNDGILTCLQYIDPHATENNKMYQSGGKTRGSYHQIGKIIDKIYIAEGFATAATIHETTGESCIAAYSASNLPHVTEHFRNKYPKIKIVVVADHDSSGIGRKYADQAAAKYSASVIMPPEPGDANDYKLAGHDLAQLLDPEPDDWLQSADDFCKQPAPIKYLIKSWIQANSLMMIAGPSGVGKTFYVLDMACSIASGQHKWLEQYEVDQGPVVYLAGEGHHGLKSRIAAWKQSRKAQRLQMWISKSGCDLNTAEGYNHTINQLDSLPVKPCLVIVDTLHRFLSGDDNSTVDAKSMIDACDSIKARYGATVILVHHTGLSSEAQDRARGSSAWRAALDMELIITPLKDGGARLRQTKVKDGEQQDDLHLELKQVSIQGWFDQYGDLVQSAVAMPMSMPATESQRENESDLTKAKKVFANAWDKSGAEVMDETKPYISRSAFKHFLIHYRDMSEKQADKESKTTTNNSTIQLLVDGNVIERYEEGWVVMDHTMGSQLMLMRTKREF